jgi:putative DNA primase/helicase
MGDRKLVVGGEVVASQRVAWHPDKRAEAVRWQTCEGEILQSERLRAVARTAATPATLMLVGCPVPAGFKLVAVEDYEPPSPIDLMLAAGGVALLSATHAAKAYPGIFRNEDAAKYALAQAGITAGQPELGSNSLIGVSIRRNGPSSCRYQLAGRGRCIAAALVDTAAVPDPRSWLEARLGPLAGFWSGFESLAAV